MFSSQSFPLHARCQVAGHACTLISEHKQAMQRMQLALYAAKPADPLMLSCCS